jgi:hypothetical protein
MNSTGHRQFKLSNGDELIAEIVDEPNQDDEVNLVVRDAMQISRVDDREEGYRYYMFKPWMTYQIKEGYFQLLNYTHIIGEAKPEPIMFGQYRKALELESDVQKKRDADLKETMLDIEEMLNDSETGMVGDSDDGETLTNIIRFDRTKLH